MISRSARSARLGLFAGALLVGALVFRGAHADDTVALTPSAGSAQQLQASLFAPDNAITEFLKGAPR